MMNSFEGFYKNKKVLITGHTGFKGSWLALWLLSMGAEVAGYALEPWSDPSLFKLLNLGKDIRHRLGDIRDLEKFHEYVHEFKPDIVFHLAAEALVSRCFNDPKRAFEVNSIGTLNVLESIRKIDSLQSAVFVTSDKCYENVEWEYGYRENDRLAGKDPYSASKSCAELIFRSYFLTYFQPANRLNLGTGRAGNVIGGGDWSENRIVPDAIRAWQNKQVLGIKSPKATRPWQHVLEPLSGYLWQARKLALGEAGGESFNFGPPSETVCSVTQLLEIMKQHVPIDYQIVKSELEKHEHGLLKLNCDKALHRLAWKPTLNLSETVQYTTEWYQKFYQHPGGAKDLSLKQINQYSELAKNRDIAWIR